MIESPFRVVERLPGQICVCEPRILYGGQVDQGRADSPTVIHHGEFSRPLGRLLTEVVYRATPPRVHWGVVEVRQVVEVVARLLVEGINVLLGATVCLSPLLGKPSTGRRQLLPHQGNRFPGISGQFLDRVDRHTPGCRSRWCPLCLLRRWRQACLSGIGASGYPCRCVAKGYLNDLVRAVRVCVLPQDFGAPSLGDGLTIIRVFQVVPCQRFQIVFAVHHQVLAVAEQQSQARCLIKSVRKQHAPRGHRFEHTHVQVAVQASVENHPAPAVEQRHFFQDLALNVHIHPGVDKPLQQPHPLGMPPAVRLSDEPDVVRPACRYLAVHPGIARARKPLHPSAARGFELRNVLAVEHQKHVAEHPGVLDAPVHLAGVRVAHQAGRRAVELLQAHRQETVGAVSPHEEVGLPALRQFLKGLPDIHLPPWHGYVTRPGQSGDQIHLLDLTGSRRLQGVFSLGLSPLGKLRGINHRAAGKYLVGAGERIREIPARRDRV